MKNKICTNCEKEFIPQRMAQHVCGWKCATSMISKQKNNEKKILKERKEKLKTRSDYLKEAQDVFNLYIRIRDSNCVCISCNRAHKGQYHAGHYLAVGSHPELRFDELNTNKQCSHCNNYLSGNQIKYRKNLIIKIGINAVEFLEGKHEPKKYTISEIQEIKRIYTLKVKDLKSKI